MGTCPAAWVFSSTSATRWHGEVRLVAVVEDEYYLGVIDLKSVKLFQGLPDSESRSIEKQMKIVRHPAGHEIVVRGEGGIGFMVITEGSVSVKTVQGKTRTLGPGDSFGEMALLDHEGRSATITADTAVTLATIPEWNFKPFLKEHPEVAYRLLQVLSQRVRQAEAEN
ncbi:MAG: Crp/Fnr family transcriptional regulator [Candidatus Dormibacteraceae bacterium]